VTSDADSWELSVGQSVAADCTVQELLGGGRDFEVFAAFDTRRLCPVVMKVLRPSKALDPAAVDRLRREIEVTGRLNHPGLVRGFHASLDPPRPYLCLERVFGPPLLEAVRDEGPVDVAVAVPLMLEAASALHYMHSQGFVHLDVTPVNVILGSPARLIDLSLARSIADATEIDGAVGTRGFQPPEIAGVDGAGYPGPWSDVWSLGATAYFGLTGETVAEGGSLPAEIPAALGDLIDSMLAESPHDRPTAEAVFESMDVLAGQLPAPRIDLFRP